ncbi:MAG: hypothetical protein PHF11_00430 [Candidatus Omnitrophica bacterium]|nr:hypothetical protein [Candidatus Omnitrophota bacterium]
MEQKSKEEKWGKPKLIVLIRSRSEEAVLASCKGAPEGAGAQNEHNQNCLKGAYIAACTSNCYNIVSS